MFLYGKNSVLQRLTVNPSSIKKIFLQENFSDLAIEKLIKSSHTAFKRVSKQNLYRIKPADNLGGIVAEVEEFQYADLADLLKTGAGKISFIFLDRVFDPQNLGSIIRSAACFDNFAVVIPKHKACRVTETVLHVASGGENFTPLVMVSNLTNALIEAKKVGFWAAGAVCGGGKDLSSTSLPFPLCLIMGSEGRGLRYGLKKHLDIEIHIPAEGAPLSFNVGVACAILCYEISKQRPR